MKEGLRQVQHHTWALLALALVPLAGIAVNLAWPPEHYAYIVEQVSLSAIALCSLAMLLINPYRVINWISPLLPDWDLGIFSNFALAVFSPVGAILLYSSLALFPVGAMIEHYQRLGGGWSALELTPLVGILFVAVFADDEIALLLYGGIAIIAPGILTGFIRGDWGQAGAMSFFAGAITWCAYCWLGCSQRRLRRELDRLRQDTGELGVLAKKISEKQQELVNDT